MTSVAARAPAETAAREASRFSVVIDSIASLRSPPVALCQLDNTPTPNGLVRVSGNPG